MYKKIIFSICLFYIHIVFSQEVAPNKKIEETLKKAFEYIDKDNDSAYIFIEQAKKISAKIKDPLYQVKVLETEGNYYGFVKNDYNKATNLYLKAVQICEKNKLNYTKNLYHSLGVLFHLTDNYEKAKIYYTKAIPLERKEKDSVLLARSLANLA